MGVFDKLKNFNLKKPGDDLKGKKSLDYLLIFILIVIVGLLYFSSYFTNSSSDTASKTETAVNAQATQSTSVSLENKLKNVLSKIEGAGEVEVMITYETGSEIVPAVTEEQTTSTTSDSKTGSSTETKSTNTKPITVTSNGVSSALVLVEKEPVVKGVIVVAQGASDLKTKLALQRAVQTVLNIDTSNIDIFTMEK